MKKRRKFTGKYKLSVLNKIDQCANHKCVQQLLNKKNLRYSTVSSWRKKGTEGILKSLTPRKRGRKSSHDNPLRPEIEKLKRTNSKLAEKLKKAEVLIQKQQEINKTIQKFETIKQKRHYLLIEVYELSRTVGPGLACSTFDINRATFYRFCKKARDLKEKKH